MTTGIYISEQALAKKWGFDPRTLQRWRSENRGPAYINMCGHIRYTQEFIEEFERENFKKKKPLQLGKEVPSCLIK